MAPDSGSQRFGDHMQIFRRKRRRSLPVAFLLLILLVGGAVWVGWFSSEAFLDARLHDGGFAARAAALAIRLRGCPTHLEELAGTHLGENDDGVARRWCAWALGAGSGERGLEWLLYSIDHEGDASARAEVARALGERGDARARPPLMRLLGSDGEDMGVRAAACWALGKPGVADRAALFLLVSTLRAPTQELRAAAHTSLIESTGVDLGMQTAPWNEWIQKHG